MRIEDEQIHYQTRFELFPYETTKPAIVEAYRCVYRWLIEKEKRRLPESHLARLLPEREYASAFLNGSLSFPSFFEGGLNESNETCVCTRAAFTDGSKIPDAWAFEYDEPDSRKALRHWHTSVGFATTPDDSCVVSAKITNYMSPDYVGYRPNAPQANVPRFIRSILSLDAYRACVGETVVKTAPTYLSFDTFQSDFVEQLLSRQRGLPFLLLVSDENGALPVSDVDRLAANLLGIANIYVVDWRDASLRGELFRLFDRSTPAFRYGCARGNARLYQTDLDITNPYDSQRHRIFFGDWLHEHEIELVDILCHSFSRGYIRREEDVIDTRDIAWRNNRRAMLDLRHRMEELKRETASRTVVPTGSEGAELSHEKLQVLESAYLDEMKSRKEWEALATSYSEANDELQEENRGLQLVAIENDRLQYELKDARERSERLGQEIIACNEEANGIRELKHIPKNCAEVLSTAEKLWPSKLIVTDAAKKSAEEFKNGDVDEAWQIASSIANVLWDCYFVSNEDDIENAYYHATSYQLALREGKQTKKSAAMMRERLCKFDGKTFDVTPHIKGKSKNPSSAFRVHFAPYRERKKIIIDHFGAHKTTAGTMKIR